MNVICALLGEHGVLKSEILWLLKAAPGLDDETLRSAALHLASAVESHAGHEDELLFVALEQCSRMPEGPVGAMRHEHRVIEDLIEQLREDGGPSAEPAQRTVQRLLDTLIHHFGHEEHVLFVLATRVLEPAALDTLGRRWAQRRSVESKSVDAPAVA